MHILITGGAGFIGSHIAEALALHTSHKVAVLDDFSSGRMENLKDFASTIEIIHHRLGDPAAKESWWAKWFAPDIIIHQAAQPSLLKSVEVPAFDLQTNVGGTLEVMGLAKKWNSKIIFASTSAVYKDLTTEASLGEEDSLAPNRPYGIAKLSAEHYIRWGTKNHLIFRYGNIYGPRQRPVGENQLIAKLLAYAFKTSDDFAINGDGLQTRDFTFVGDVVKVVLEGVNQPLTGTFNLATSVETSVNEVCEEVKKLLDLKEDFPHKPAKEGEPRRVCLDNRKLMTALGLSKPTLKTVKDGLVETVDWWRSTHGTQPVG